MAAADPLQKLGALISEAASLPQAEPYQPSIEPLRQLSDTIRGLAPPATKASAVTSAPSAQPAAAAVADSGDALEALVGREVLRLVAAQPLSAAARAEAVRRLSLALQNPNEQNLRAVLAVLVSDRADV